MSERPDRERRTMSFSEVYSQGNDKTQETQKAQEAQEY